MIDPNDVKESCQQAINLLNNDTLLITKPETNSDLEADLTESEKIGPSNPTETLFMPSSELMRKIIDAVRVFDEATKEELLSRFAIETDKSLIPSE